MVAGPRNQSSRFNLLNPQGRRMQRRLFVVCAPFISVQNLAQQLCDSALVFGHGVRVAHRGLCIGMKSVAWQEPTEAEPAAFAACRRVPPYC